MNIKSFAIQSVGILGLATVSMAGVYMPPSKGPVVYEEEALGFDVGVGYDSKYVFRGVDFGDHSVWGSVDYATALTDTIELGLGVWGQANYETHNSFEELDVIGGLTFALGPVDLGLGVIWYYFPNDDTDALEIGASLGSSVGPADLGLAVAYDESTDGWYFEYSVESVIELTDRVALVPGALVSYGDSYYGVSGWNNVGLSLAMPVALTDTATLTPYIAGSFAIDSLEDLGEKDHFYGGISLSVSF